MELIVTIPVSYPAERDYILSVILKEFLGLDYISQRSEKAADFCITDKDKVHHLLIPDGLFAIPEVQWLTQESLPKQPLEVWDPRTVGLCYRYFLPVPVIYGAHKPNVDGEYYLRKGQDLRLPFDVFGSCFFMLTRYEEIVKPDRDEHDRFPSKAMLCYQEGFVERPIVNEYLEILWACLQKLWPGLTRKKREYRLCLSHDVDEILCVVEKPFKQVIKRIGRDAIVKRDPFLALRSMQAACQGIAEKDPYNTFDFIMDVSEKYGITSTFNFMTSMGYSEYDQRYSIDHPWVRKCIRRIAQRGHLIGFHPTYGSYLNNGIINNEFNALRRIAQEEGGYQNEWGGRQHYLRWQNPVTWQHWENAGLNYDGTVGFADLIGFRTGCCYEYPVFNLQERKKLNLRERSLIVMEVVALNDYGTFTNEFRETISHLHSTCKKYDGDFTLLWHNENVISRQQRKSYMSTISSL